MNFASRLLAAELAAASIEEWAGIRADLAGVIRRPFGYAGPVYPLDACVWFRESTGEWVLEIAGAIKEGAEAFLKRQNTTIVLLAALLAGPEAARHEIEAAV